VEEGVSCAIRSDELEKLVGTAPETQIFGDTGVLGSITNLAPQVLEITSEFYGFAFDVEKHAHRPQ